VCDTGYTLEKCHKDMAVFRKALAKYPAAQLGPWTWILVRSADWKAILLPRRIDPDCPAFTYLPKRETFIEESLVSEVPGRGRELLLRWHVGLDRLLDLAVAHELGHALCNERDEKKVDQVAEILMEQRFVSCDVNLEAEIQPRTMQGVR
jgi:hypothetical protein